MKAGKRIIPISPACAALLMLPVLLLGPFPAFGVDFFGATLCRNSVTTSISLPEDSGLRLASVETGEDNGLLMLLYATRGDAMENLDVLMTRITGHAGRREGDSMQWSGRKILAYASLVKKGTLAMALSSSDPCEPTPAIGPVPSKISPPAAAALPSPAPPAAIPVKAAALPPVEHEAAALDEEEDFRLEGKLQWTAGPPPWIDVMGVINSLGQKDYRLAAFDLSFYDAEGGLLCVDTISIGMLKAGRTRAFRDSVNCPGLDPARIKSYRIQFSGGE